MSITHSLHDIESHISIVSILLAMRLHQEHLLYSSCTCCSSPSSFCYRYCSHCVCCCYLNLQHCSECLARLRMDCMSFSKLAQQTFTQTRTGPSFLRCWSALVLGHILPELLVTIRKTKAIKVCYSTRCSLST